MCYVASLTAPATGAAERAASMGPGRRKLKRAMSPSSRPPWRRQAVMRSRCSIYRTAFEPELKSTTRFSVGPMQKGDPPSRLMGEGAARRSVREPSIRVARSAVLAASILGALPISPFPRSGLLRYGDEGLDC
jgi:hypothetical protein